MLNGELNTLHFPLHRTVGWVKIPKEKHDPHNHWELVASAIGVVNVPIDVPVRLVVEPFAASDLSWLNQIEPNQITEMYLVQTDVNDKSLEHVARLDGLQVLTLSHTYKNISDAGSHHFLALKNLHKLSINATDIGDIALLHICTLDKLETLSIGATKITDVGLKSLYTLPSIREISFDNSYSGARSNHFSDKGIELLKEALPNCLIKINAND